MTDKEKRLLVEVKKAVDRLEKKNVVVKPQDLVNEARAKHSPLHKFFVWDDSEAAESYRRHQAGQYIGRCKVYYKDGRKERGYQKVKVKVQYNGDEKMEEGYVSTARVLSEEELRSQVIKSGLRELHRWKVKYSAYDELMELVDASKMSRVRIVVKK